METVTPLSQTNSNQWLKKFLPIWSAQLFSLLGSSLVQFALVWYLTEKTGSVEVLTTATIMSILPQVLLSPFAGALVDRWNRRIVMIVSDGATAFFTLILVILFALGKVQIWQIYAIMFLRAIGGIFQWPAMTSSTSLMVPEKHLSRVAGINQAIQGGLNIVAPPLGALLMSLLAFYQVISIDIITAIIAITPLFFIKIPQPVRQDNNETVTVRTVFKDVAEGFRYMKSLPGMIMLTIVAAFINFTLAPTDSLLPLLVTQHFQKGVWELSLLESVLGIGVIAGGILLGIWGGFKSKIGTSMMGVIGLGVGVGILGIAPATSFWMALVGFALVGLMMPMANGPLQAIMQSRIAPELQGRVMSFLNSFCAAMMPIGLLIVNPVVKAAGLQTWFWFSGILTICLGISALFMPKVMSLDKAQSVLADAVVTVE
ncbi:MAG: MFS transporter [Anaerolineaceae bacterium]|nr:MFS transporter [Anaerolineaceae bacterium]